MVESRTLTSAWIETNSIYSPYILSCVALSRVRGLKLCVIDNVPIHAESHSHECVD